MIMFRVNHCTYLVTSVSRFHTSTTTHLNQGWRNAKKFVRNPNTAGPLLTLQDYSFKDNKPTPYGANQLKRMQRHQQYAKKIIQLVSEVDYAVERHAKLLKEKEEQKQQILDSKLKPKGQQLITSE
ncbi:39S ribosomal protein L52, mitochondrial [Osmia bicornis bicornis]|uniref:39S ribosomal protein L52, mitochondrial n=1 Tax=Osmia bicornis bicornis TaxID=1437191 RepID=UPI0010F45AFA|nr:39S ribosomal protein L52, mitochondrial [Osmia bicornis bicornis]